MLCGRAWWAGCGGSCVQTAGRRSTQAAAWSHDGRYLYYLKPYADPPAILRLRVPHSRPEQVADLSILDHHRGSFTLWSSAPGDIPLLIRRDYNDEIYAYDLKLP